ncbi:MAG: type I polyketide synthase [Chloroflexota bacterium]
MNYNNQPIAIIGMGCRFPGEATNPQRFWSLLCNGADAISEVPTERWDWRLFYDEKREKLGKTASRWGGFLPQVDQFDAPFFGIAPREAMMMDPQHRLLLEITWEALEAAGQIHEELTGSSTGVFIGISAHDYGDIQAGMTERYLGNAYTNIGNATSLIANRISYKLGLQGPSFALDTACSSALTAVHLACQSIWQGESSMALAGGVNLMLRPELTIGFSKASMLSPDGRCKSFDAQGNGYVRGEGAGIIVLKPYAAALADGDSIAAVIRGTAINQDGRTSSITIPGQAAQEAMLAQAYEQAGVAPHHVQYVEAHGTGTPVGDPIEAKALGAVLGRNRPVDDACLIGSAKSNIGHLEAGSGIAGLIKAVLCIQHGQIPPSLHFETPNPDIPFEELKLRVVDELVPWPDNGHPRTAGVNSFGFGGANAHVVVQEPPPPPNLPQTGGGTVVSSTESQLLSQHPTETSPHTVEVLAPKATKRTDPSSTISQPPPLLGEGRGGVSLLTLSARSEPALKALAASYADFLRTDTDASLADLAYTMTRRRSHHDHRLALLVRNRQQLTNRLRAVANDERVPNLLTGRCNTEEAPSLLFVYTGMGPQWWGMGRELAEREPVFRQSLVDCNAAFQKIAGWSLLEAMSAPEETSRMAETAVAQPANFALQVALSALWASWGVKPTAVVGHSVGEIAAAYIAGALSLEDALLVTHHRSRLQQTTAGQGTMLAAELSAADAEALLAAHEQVSLAAINGPTSVTLAGDAKALQAIAAELQAQERFSRFLEVEVAYHSYQMDPLADELQASLAHIQPQSAAIPLYSTVTGQQIEGDTLNADYWWRNVRQPVQLAPVMQRIIRDDYRIFLEVGPHPVLGHSIRETLRAEGEKGRLLPSLRRQKPEQTQLLSTLAELYTLGAQVDWSTISPSGRFIKLPTYPWQRERYWQESPASRQDRLGQPGHPFLKLDQELPTPTWQVELNDYLFPYLQDHRVEDAVVFPAAGYVEAGLALHTKLFGESACTLEEVAFKQILAIDPAQVHMMQMSLDQASNRCTIYSTVKRPIMADDEKSEIEWTEHATMRVLPTPVNARPALDFTAIQARCQEEGSVTELYTALSQGGLHYGPHFQTNRQIWRNDNEVLTRIEGPDDASSDGDYLLHPTVLDATFQAIAAIIGDQKRHADQLYLPVGMDQLTFYAPPIDAPPFYAPPSKHCWAYGKVTRESGRIIESDIVIFNEDGEVAVDLRGVRYQAIARRQEAVRTDWFYEFSWKAAKLTPSEGEGRQEMPHLNGTNGSAPIQNGSLVHQNLGDKPLNENTVEQKSIEEAAHWLIIGGRDPLTEQVRQSLHDRGVQSTLVCPGDVYSHEAADLIQIRPDQPEDMGQLLDDLGEMPFSDIVYLWSLGDNRNQVFDNGCPLGAVSSATPMTAILDETMPVVTLAQALATRESSDKIHLTIVSNGSQSVPANEGQMLDQSDLSGAVDGIQPVAAPEQSPSSDSHLTGLDSPDLLTSESLHTAPLWGLGALISNENPNITCKLIDVGLNKADSIHALVTELLDDNLDEDVALRGAERFVKQILPAPHLLEDAEPETATVHTSDAAVTLEIGHPGQLDSLFFRQSQRRAPAAGEVEIQVHATALNFKDLLKVLDHLDAQVTAGTYFEDHFGMECAGTVVAVGNGVNDLQVGDAVIVTTPGCFASYVTVEAQYAVRKPSTLALHEAPVLTGYLTAYYSLMDVARLQAGERVLIHNATGGVGVAALQIAQWIGADIYATAGTDEKRGYLASLGVENVFDSRSLAFADQIKQATDRQGVDVVLNAIAGESLRKSLSILAPYGRFVEIGKKDIAENSGLPLAAFNRNLTFTAIDLDRIWKERLPLAQRLMAEVLQGFEEGHWHAMPVTVFPASQAGDAFRFLGQSKQMGKVVLEMAQQEVSVVPLPEPTLHGDGTYLITGGTSGLGLEIAQWLATKGVGQLVLVSRSGAKTEQAQEAIAGIERNGTAVHVAQVDISDAEQVAGLVRQIAAGFSPLRGIFHGAMVLDDALLVDLDRSRFERVMAPKVAGALNLHAATLEQPLDFFVMFSSISSLIGNVGQGNYVAANAFLDGFAHYRRAQGLPATTINLGVLAEVGVVARDEQIEQLLSSAGISGFTTQQVLQALETIIERKPVQVGLFDVDWQQQRKSNPRLAQSSRFAHFMQGDIQANGSGTALLAELRTLAPEERLAFVANRVRDGLAAVLQLPVEKIDLDQKSNLLGVDSLMALELKQKLDSEFGVEIPTMQLLNGPTVTQMAQILLREVVV